MSQIDYLRTRLPIPTSHCSGPHASHNLALTCGRLRRVGNKNPSPYLHLFRRGCIALAAHRSQQEQCSAQQREEHRMDCPYQSRISPFSSFRVPPTTSQSSSAGSPLRSAERRTFQSKSPNSFASSIGGCSVRNIRTLRNSAVSSIDIFNSSLLRRGVSSWGQHHQFRVLEPSKPADRRVGRPTHLSAMFSQTSASSYFGLKIQRLVSLLRLIAACAKPSAFSVAIVNGQATPKPQSSLKFYDGKRCAT